eukprot:m.54919 g.54919  ORF g.54919 m.54919 type:complete len:53 (+) comp13649_c0_seq7:1004-1162(+)
MSAYSKLELAVSGINQLINTSTHSTIQPQRYLRCQLNNIAGAQDGKLPQSLQ